MQIVGADFDKAPRATDNFEHGRLLEWVSGGNDTTVELLPEGALIINEFPDPSELLVPLEEVCAAVEGWRKVVSTKPS